MKLLPRRRAAARSRPWLWLVLVVAIVGGAEWGARWVLGLGDPPLYIEDDAIEYYLRAGEYRRFGRTIAINTFGMRGPEVAAKKPDGALRVLVLGDSIAYGGHRVDQSQLPWPALERGLSRQLGRQVQVLNASASSWGPPNVLAYLERFGHFDCDLALYVLSTQDLTDVPTFQSSLLRPTEKPWCALQDLVWALRKRSEQAAAEDRPEDADLARRTCQASLATLVAKFAQLQVPLVLAQHPTREEYLADSAGPAAEFAELLPTSRFLWLKGAYEAGSASVYSDQIHLAPRGLALLAQGLEASLLELLRP